MAAQNDAEIELTFELPRTPGIFLHVDKPQHGGRTRQDTTTFSRHNNQSLAIMSVPSHSFEVQPRHAHLCEFQTAPKPRQLF